MAQLEKSENKKKTSKKVVENKKKNSKVSDKKVKSNKKQKSIPKKKIKDLSINERNKDKKNNNDFSLREVVLIVIITCIVACACTGCIMYFKNRSTNSIAYHKLTGDKKLSEFVDIYSDILDKFYDEVDKDKVLDAAINGMISSLGDDYTSYLTEDEAQRLNDSLSGEYIGIGIQILDNVIVNVFEDSPAYKVGIKTNDVIKKINGIEVTEEDAVKITDVIKTGDNDTVNIVVARGDDELAFDVTRTTLDVPAISYTLKNYKNKKIGYLYISSFSNTLVRQVRKALEKMETSGIDSLIIDVRNNTGGYLHAATGVSNLFLKKDKIIYSLDSKDGITKYFDDTDEHREYKIAVLINGATASSSEILAAALKDSYGATIIGTTSYGKGKVQTKKDLSNGTIVKYTNSRWLRPNGECVDKVGIIPDYEVELEYSKDETTVIDTQLQKALELLGK